MSNSDHSAGLILTAILALLLRLYEPCQGSLTFGGLEAKDVALDELRSKCAYVSQDPHLFEGTIRWNLCREYGLMSSSEEL